MRRETVLLGAVTAIVFAVPSAFGAAISVPETGASYGDVGSWGVTWGGSGIPTDHSAYKEFTHTIDSTTYTIRIAMRAHGRFSYGETADPSAPIYYVETGKFGGSGLDKDYAKWNFDFYVAVLDSSNNLVTTSGLFGAKLLYDFDPGAGTDESGHGVLQGVAPAWNGSSVVNPFQDTWNLAMPFLATDNPPYIDAPSVAFNPNVNGEYTFRLSIHEITWTSGPNPPFVLGTELGAVSMKVNAVPEPASMVALGGLGLVGAGWGFVRRRKRAKA